MEKLTEIYDALNQMGVLVQKGSYGLSGKCDSTCVKVGPWFGVFLDMARIRTTAEELDAASHEWAHITGDATYGVDAPPEIVQKAETRADRIQIERVVPFEEMQNAMLHGCTNTFMLSERLGVTEDLIRKAYNYYTGPCGLHF